MSGPIRFIDPDTGTELGRIDRPEQTSEMDVIVDLDGATMTTFGVAGVMRYALPSGQPLYGRRPRPARRRHPRPSADDPQVVVARFDDGTISRYDTARQRHVGAAVDVGFVVVVVTAILRFGMAVDHWRSFGLPRQRLMWLAAIWTRCPRSWPPRSASAWGASSSRSSA